MLGFKPPFYAQSLKTTFLVKEEEGTNLKTKLLKVRHGISEPSMGLTCKLVAMIKVTSLVHAITTLNIII